MTRRTSETVYVGLARCADLYALGTAHRIYLVLLYKGVLVRVVKLHRDEKTQAKNGERLEIVAQDSTHRGFF